MSPFRNILCPIDFSEYSLRALRYAVSLGTHYHASLVVQHIVAPIHTVYFGYMVPGSASPDYELSLQRQAETMLNEYIREIVADRVPCRGILSLGSTTEEILSCAASSHADLIVMGTHGRSGFEHLMLGSVTEKLIRKARCPVLVVRHLGHGVPEAAAAAEDLHYRSILVPVDLTEHSVMTLSYARQLAREYGARLTVLHVLERVANPIVDPGYTTMLIDYWKEAEAEALRQLQELIVPAVQEGLAVDHSVAIGKVSEGILQAAQEQKADLVVMGARDSWASHLTAIGNTAHRVLSHVECPVLLLRGGPA